MMGFSSLIAKNRPVAPLLPHREQQKIKATSGCGQPSASRCPMFNPNFLLASSPVLRPLFCGRTAQVVQERIPSVREECEIAVGFGLDVLKSGA